MSSNIISPSDASLLLHRFVTEQIRVAAWFVSSDRSVKCRVDGFVTGYSQADGMFISTEHPHLKPDSTLPAYLIFSHDSVAASTFQYSDDTSVPSGLPVGSGLRIHLPNGDTLTLMEIRDKRNRGRIRCPQETWRDVRRVPPFAKVGRIEGRVEIESEWTARRRQGASVVNQKFVYEVDRGLIVAAGPKGHPLLGRSSARLKPCPDTSPPVMRRTYDSGH